eukprot:3382695-Pleurochrysis_carterae.AAC.3
MHARTHRHASIHSLCAHSLSRSRSLSLTLVFSFALARARHETHEHTSVTVSCVCARATSSAYAQRMHKSKASPLGETAVARSCNELFVRATPARFATHFPSCRGIWRVAMIGARSVRLEPGPESHLVDEWRFTPLALLPALGFCKGRFDATGFAQKCMLIRRVFRCRSAA